MKGTKRERPPGSKHWQLRVYVGRNPKGTPVFRTKTFVGGVRAADDALRQFVERVQSERPELLEDSTVAELLERWLRHIEGERTAYTLYDYRQKIAQRINPALGHLKLSKLSPQLLDAAYRQWRKEVSPATVRKCHAILAAACHQAVKWGTLVSSPTDRATLPRAEHVERGTMSAADISTMLNDRDLDAGDVLTTAIVLAALTGARRGELCALRWSDVDDHALSITRSLTVRKTAWSEGPTKGRRGRPVQLGDFAAYVLGCRRSAQISFSSEVGVELGADPFVLSRSAAGDLPCLPDGLTLGFRRLAKKHGLPWHFHDLRHWAATVAMDTGTPRAVADRLGHSDPALTLRVYTHADEVADRALADNVEAAFPLALPPVGHP